MFTAKNEAGKSTLVNLISRTLFQNARIDGRSDKSFRDSYFPTQRKGSAAAGDSIDGSVTISDGEDTYKLTKEWGADPRCKLTTPDGTISGQDSVNDRLRELLQYGEGVYNELLLSSHTRSRVLETLMNAKDKSATRQEIVDAVSATFAESGGASLDAIENAIKGKIAEMEGAHWDADRDAPVKKAGKWKTGIGTILKAYYDLEDAQKNVSSLHELEQSVTEAMQKYEHACTAVEEAEDAYNRFNAFAGALAARRDRAKIIKRLEDDVKKYATILAEWPKLVKQLDAARVLKAEKSASELKSKYEKVKAIASELDALKARAASRKKPVSGRAGGCKGCAARHCPAGKQAVRHEPERRNNNAERSQRRAALAAHRRGAYRRRRQRCHNRSGCHHRPRGYGDASDTGRRGRRGYRAAARRAEGEDCGYL